MTFLQTARVPALFLEFPRAHSNTSHLSVVSPLPSLAFRPLLTLSYYLKCSFPHQLWAETPALSGPVVLILTNEGEGGNLCLFELVCLAWLLALALPGTYLCLSFGGDSWA